MKIQNIIPLGFKNNLVNNSNPINQNKFIYNQNDGNCDVYEASCPKEISFRGIPRNFGEVIEKKLFRGGLPEVEHFKELAAKGITHILDLCGTNSIDEAKLAVQHGIKYCHVDQFKYPNKRQLAEEIARQIDDGIKDGAVYVHCDRGETRTGSAMIYYELKNGVPADIVKQHCEEHGGSSDFANALIEVHQHWLQKNA